MTKAKLSTVDDESKPVGTKVLKRFLNDNAPIPLFIAQTFISTLRDVGYNSTTSALCEHVDNAIQAKASEIRIYFNQTGTRGAYSMDTLIYDNGVGMEPNVLQMCMSFGGSMSYNKRSGIGRFGVGMKTAALSMSPVLDVYSWVEEEAFYRMTLDVEKVYSETAGVLSLSEPEFLSKIPDEIADILTKQMVYPKSNQDYLATKKKDLYSSLRKSGSIIYMPDCDRLSYQTARTLVDHATSEMSRVYREYINNGVKIYVNNRLLTAVDPCYWMKAARHAGVEDLKAIDEKCSNLVNTWEIQVPISEDSDLTAPVSVRLYKLPYDSWGKLPRKVLDKKLDIYNRNLVSVLRNDREVFCGVRPMIFKYHGDAIWLRVRIDFSGELDEAFGVAMNKQGIRPKSYVDELIKAELEADITRIRGDVAKSRKAKNQPKPIKGEKTESERRAQEADAHQMKKLPSPKAETEREKAEMSANIRGLAVAMKREGETEDQAFDRITTSTYLTKFIHDDYHPFYTIEARYGKVILTINKAHSFYSDLYGPLAAMVSESVSDSEDENNSEEKGKQSQVLAALEMLFFSLGRTQTVLMANDKGEQRDKLYRQMHIEWSNVLETQLSTK